VDIRKAAKFIWQITKVLWRVVWGLLGLLALAMQFDSSWVPFTDHVEKTGILAFAASVFHVLINLFVQNALGILCLIGIVAILYILLVDRAKTKSREQTKAAAKKPHTKKKKK
jgi:hypothetical protein